MCLFCQSEEQSAQERSDADVQIVFERKPTADQAELAAGLMLPHTFFCYRNDPGHASHEDDDDGKNMKGLFTWSNLSFDR